MMKIPGHIAEKIMQLSQGETIPAGSAKHKIIDDLVSEGIVERKGRIKKTLSLFDNKALADYLKNRYSIPDLSLYIQTGKKELLTRTELIAATSDSKYKKVRTFKGFLINSYEPIELNLENKIFEIQPITGLFHFIYDFENFSIPENVTIVGIENPENFRHIEKEKYLFSQIQPIFVSRYPQSQSKDLIKWLKSIPNNYLHFGDFDIAGIGIYLNEYKKHLKGKASFFVPNDIEELIKKYGNRKVYDEQKINFNVKSIHEEDLLKLIEIIHKYRKGLEQEILIKNVNTF